ncbi:MAG TPA: hypothetical protein VK589_18700 [Chryseolinea sp.]|nr:hypothetical protein [Chryseolinea sp.]
MIDSKSLFYTVHYILKQIHFIDNLESWPGTKETIQHITIDDQKFTLMVILKQLEGDCIEGVVISETMDQGCLIDAAQELVSAEPRPTGYEFFKKDVQQFSDLNEKKFILTLTLSAADEPLL